MMIQMKKAKVTVFFTKNKEKCIHEVNESDRVKMIFYKQKLIQFLIKSSKFDSYLLTK